MKEIKENDISHLKGKECHILFYFTATWCGPCKRIAPSIVKLDEGLTEKKIKFCKVDIDENEEFCDKCDIRAVPTFYIMNGKNLLSQCSGADIKTIGEMIINTFNTFNEKLLNKVENK